MNLENKTILMAIAPSDFRDEELLIPKEFWEDVGAKIVITSDGVGRSKGMFGAMATIDIDISEINASGYDAVVFVGGRGVDIHGLCENSRYIGLVKSANDQEKILGAICLAPNILASAGVLNGKNATVWGSPTYIESRGAIYTGELVTQDGRIITGKGPEAAKEFAEKIADMIEGA